MGRPRKDISKLIGKRLHRSRLVVLGYVAKADSHRSALVRCRCEHGTETVTRLSYVLARHTVSCGCVKHQRYTEHMQRAVKGLSPTLTLRCFLSFIDPKAPKPDLADDRIKAGYYRRTEELKSLPNSVMVTLRERVIAHDDYASIARDTGLHTAEVAWLAKYVIRPEARQRDRALLNIYKAKNGREEEQRWRRRRRERKWGLDYEEWRRERELQEERFSASELHNPGSKASQKAWLDFDSLDFAWHWMKTSAPHMKLDSDEQDLLRWFRETAERTFQWRRDNRREMARRQREKKWSDMAAAA